MALMYDPEEPVTKKGRIEDSFNIYEGAALRNVLNQSKVTSSRVSQAGSDIASVRSAQKPSRLTNGALQTLSKVGSLHETDIFKICIKTMQKSQIAQVLTPTQVKTPEGDDLDHDLLLEQAYK